MKPETGRHLALARELVIGIPVNSKTYNLSERIARALSDAETSGMLRAAVIADEQVEREELGHAKNAAVTIAAAIRSALEQSNG